MGLYINNTKIGMPYINSIKYNAYINGNKIWNGDPYPPAPSFEENTFALAVQGNTVCIPVSGMNLDLTQYLSFNWRIDWGDGKAESIESKGGKDVVVGHYYSDNKEFHIIKIKPNSTVSQGWFNAFGSGYYQNTSYLTNIKKIYFPITPFMKTGSYYYMFYKCTGLISVPLNLLPATTLFDGCYRGMFYSCTSLTSVPLLPAVTLFEGCYEFMFFNCTSLTSIPPDLLPAATLTEYCYRQLFYNCTNLVDIGNINSAWFSGKPAQFYMFANCTKITTPITYAQIPNAWKVFT
jgi:hypothetical protein